MMQGDSYRIPIEISTESGTAGKNSFEEIEVFIGPLRKTLSSGDITFDEERSVFLIHIDQEDTLDIQAGRRRVQVRVKLPSGDVIGVDAGSIDIVDAISQVVL